MKVENLRDCLPICCATCEHLNKFYGLGGVKCKLEAGPSWSRADLIDAHYHVCDRYRKEIE